MAATLRMWATAATDVAGYLDMEGDLLAAAGCMLCIGICRHLARRDRPLQVGRADICLRVCDTGPGLPAAARQNLFVAFQGGARAGGTGLGLAIAADLVRAHRGTIRVLDGELADEWPGARFEIRFPAVAGSS